MRSGGICPENRPASRLVLGTAQLGMPYGIANRTGQPDFKTAVALIKTAWEYGIREFDTAQGYGDSESVLGRAFADLGIANDVLVITKLDPKLDHRQGHTITHAIARSLERLHLPALHGLMLHREEWVDSLDHGLGKTLRTLVREGAVRHLGVSVYTPAKALQVLKSDFMDMVQVPANILDRRFAAAGVFEVAQAAGKPVYIRSVFLQGLLLMKPEELPPRMAFAIPALRKVDTLCEQHQYSRQQIALLYIKATYPQARIVLGAETVAQLEQNLTIWNDNAQSIFPIDDVDGWSMLDEKLINPASWT
jgi:aryl-alcohol dehydrogenase-like predicted oxidoreductase